MNAADLTSSSKNFLSSIHIMRGIAALMVVWSHLVGFWLYSTSGTWSVYTFFYNNLMLPFHLYHGLGHLGVVIFFLISGYIISLAVENDTRKAFVIKRVFRIFPALIAAVFFTGFINFVLDFFGFPIIPGTSLADFRDLLGSALLFDQLVYFKNGILTVTWTLVVEILFYALAAVFFTRMSSRPIQSTLLILLVPSVIIVLMPSVIIVWPGSKVIMSSLSHYTVYFPIFAIGRLTYLYRAKKIEAPEFAVMNMVTAVLFIQLYEHYQPGYLFETPTTLPIYTYIQAVLIFWGAILAKPKKSKFLYFFANISYSLYLFHIPMGIFVLTVLDGKIAYEWSLLLSFLASVLISTASWKLIEIPAQRSARRLLERSDGWSLNFIPFWAKR